MPFQAATVTPALVKRAHASGAMGSGVQRCAAVPADAGVIRSRRGWRQHGSRPAWFATGAAGTRHCLAFGKTPTTFARFFDSHSNPIAPIGSGFRQTLSESAWTIAHFPMSTVAQRQRRPSRCAVSDPPGTGTGQDRPRTRFGRRQGASAEPIRVGIRAVRCRSTETFNRLRDSALVVLRDDLEGRPDAVVALDAMP